MTAARRVTEEPMSTRTRIAICILYLRLFTNEKPKIC